MIETYRDLRVWQRAMDLVVAAYDIIKLLPRDELYSLSAQIKRSATSVAANIAEGYGRGSKGAYVNHLSIARGSLKECETHVLACIRLRMVTEDQANPFFDLSQQVGKMLNGLIDSLER
ncbi:MAG: four helix bundle protein [Hyphomicrobiaceae bacterium]